MASNSVKCDGFGVDTTHRPLITISCDGSSLPYVVASCFGLQRGNVAYEYAHDGSQRCVDHRIAGRSGASSSDMRARGPNGDNRPIHYCACPKPPTRAAAASRLTSTPAGRFGSFPPSGLLHQRRAPAAADLDDGDPDCRNVDGCDEACALVWRHPTGASGRTHVALEVNSFGPPSAATMPRTAPRAPAHGARFNARRPMRVCAVRKARAVSGADLRSVTRSRRSSRRSPVDSRRRLRISTAVLAAALARRLVSCRCERNGSQAGVLATSAMLVAKFSRPIQRGHEGAGAVLDVHDHPRQPRGELLDRIGGVISQPTRPSPLRRGSHRAPVGRRESPLSGR